MNIELWRNVKIVDTSATATKRLIKIIAVSLVTAILLGTTIGHTKTMDNKDTNKDIELLKTRIKKHEGNAWGKPVIIPYHLEYTDANGKDIKETWLTGGYGTKLSKNHKEPEGGYTAEYWNERFEIDFKKAHEGALKLLGTETDYRAIGVVTEMIYQMGYDGVSKFEKTLDYMERGEWKLASTEMLDSKWAVQTKNRATDLSKIIANIQ